MNFGFPGRLEPSVIWITSLREWSIRESARSTPLTRRVNHRLALGRYSWTKGSSRPLFSLALTIRLIWNFPRWVRTGDKVTVNEDGDLFLVGRQKVRR